MAIVGCVDVERRIYHNSKISNSVIDEGNNINNRKTKMDANQRQREQSKQQVNQMRERMKVTNTSSFSQQQQERLRQGKEWDSLWEDGITPWDLGRSTPALLSEVDSRLRQLRQEHAESMPQSTRSAAHLPTFRHCLIPGCGSGYDLVALAKYFDEQHQQKQEQYVIVGLEISRKSLERAQHVIEESYSGSSSDSDMQSSSCGIELYHGDFFESPQTWTQVYARNGSGSSSSSPSSSTTTSIPMKYDFIFDYLFFCALPPTLRQDWGKQMSNLLARKPKKEEDGSRYHDGQLLTLMFPYYDRDGHNDDDTQQQLQKLMDIGPPYKVNVEDYRQVLEPHGVILQPPPPPNVGHGSGSAQLQQSRPQPYPSPDTIPQRQGQELVGWWTFASTSSTNTKLEETPRSKL